MLSLSRALLSTLRHVAIWPLPWLLIALTACLPFLSWLRFAPNSDWIGNAMALLLALLLILCGLLHMPASLRLSPALAMAGVLTLAAVAPLAGAPYPGTGLSLLAVIWLAALVAQTVVQLPREQVITTLCIGLVLGVGLQLLIGAVQVLGLVQPWGLWWVVSDGQHTLFGNIAQRNQYANYLTLALLAACWLYGRGRLRAWLLVPLLLLLALFLAWSASRLVLAYAMGLALLAGVMLWLTRGSQSLTPTPLPEGEGLAVSAFTGGGSAANHTLSPVGRGWRVAPGEGGDVATLRMAKALLFALLAIMLCQLFTAQINAALNAIGLPVNQASGIDRFMDGGFGARRWIEWQKAWSVFMAHPLFGVGLGGYAAQSVLLEPAFAGQWSESWLFTHCHNIVLQLLAETGIVGTLAVAGALLWAFLPWFKRENVGADALLVLGLALVLLGHSLFEYPLWYASFLMVFAVLMGVSPAKGFALPVRPALRRVGVLALVLVLAWQVIVGLVMYFDWVRWVMPSRDVAENKARIESLLQHGANPVWSYEADQLLSNYLDGSANHLALKLPLFERLAAYRPYPGTLIKLAMLRAHQGDAAGAEVALRQAIASFPDTAPQLAAMLAGPTDAALKPLQQISARAALAHQQAGASAAAQTVRTP
ncbi:O-antigen ligase family protein [Craterilacuibacter sinensis]|uniref:Virulence factor membrane-bound polymerase C-terminal domain-containing protein n=1 Tax=Craterilacuibacter sinensis TaxID=2686017 RepID=A0A845BMV0_9NEIS|nr:O-antigen ligase family protein [Craterilacuibacter sinensis]MXR36594.1 hypothetical protein [Craterilacuibacter sinensis]